MSDVLSKTQIDALQAVDLRLGWVHHGYSASPHSEGWPVENGPAQLWVTDTDYAIPHRLLADMGPGDVSARERDFTLYYSYGDSRPPAHMIDTIAGDISDSPYTAGKRPLEAVDRETLAAARTASDPGEILKNPVLKEALEDSLELGRTLRLISPFDYADGLALVRGVRQAIADVGHEHEYAEVHARNSVMAHRLGDLAVEMTSQSDRPGDWPPKLAFTAGKDHKGVEAILNSYDIAYRSHTARETVSDGLLIVKRLFTPIERSRAMQIRHAARQWFSNLRAKGHAPLNEQLGTVRSWDEL